LLVTHDVEEALLLADRVVLLREGHLGFEVDVQWRDPARSASSSRRFVGDFSVSWESTSDHSARTRVTS